MRAVQNPDIAAAERRIAPRLQPAFRTICRLLPRGASGEPSIGLVWNISETGLSMLVAHPPTPGAEMAGELVAEEGGAETPIDLQVVHVRPSSTGDYILGARFCGRLDSLAMQSFLAAPTTAGSGPWTLPRKG